MSRPLPLLELTPREREVLHLLAEGMVAKQIAAELGITAETTRGYLKALMMKLDAHTQLQVVLAAARCGLLPDGHPLAARCTTCATTAAPPSAELTAGDGSPR